MTSRVVVVGPLAETSLEASLRNRGHQPLVAEDLRHALLLQRMFQPTALVFPRVPSADELALLASSASRPVVVNANVDVKAAIDLVRQGVARVVPASSPPSVLDGVLQLPLARERPVVRAVAQLSLHKATGVLDIANSEGGEIAVENGSIVAVKGGGKTGSEALAALAAKDAPVAFEFIENAEASTSVDLKDFIAIDDDTGFDGGFDGGFDIEFTAPGDHKSSASQEQLLKLRKPRCLVVEDDLDLSQLYRVLLRARGFDVDVAHDGDDGFAVAVQTPPDVILSDIMMPKVSGWDLLGLVRNNARLREVPFLVFSHHREMLTKLKTANGGADAYLEKSLRPEAVVAAVVDAAQPLRDIESSIEEGGARFEGVLAGIGPQTLLRMCNRRRLTGRLAVRPAAQRFLISLQDGDIVDAQCSMGTQTLHHRDALRALLLVDDGPFTFVKGPAPPTAPKTALLPLLDELCAELEHWLDDLRSGALLNGSPLTVRRELLDVYRSTSPLAAQPVLDQIERGGAPRDLIASGAVDLVLVDSVVRDLFRKGVIAP